jgi:hypothetical protein
MALVQLSDVVVPEVYADYQAVDGPEKTAFVESGVIARTPILDQKASSGGKFLDIPFWKDLDASQEPNYSNDSETSATPNKIQAGEQIARIAYLNQGYKAADLAGEIAGSDPMQRIRNRFGAYWQRQFQRRVIAVARGVLNANVAQNSGDMLVNIASEAGNSATDANKFSREAFVDAVFTLGDASDGIAAVGVHSVVYKRMINQEDIDFIPDSQGRLTIPTYLGKRVIVDDGLPVIAGTTNGFKYVTALFGPGALGYGEGSAKMPVELERQAAQGNGGGVETLWERKTWLLHPFGYQFTSNTVTGESPTLANLQVAANWSRVIERKNVPMAFLITN